MSRSCTCHNATVSRSCLGHVLVTVMSPLARESWSCDCCVTVLSCSTHVPVTWLPSLRLEMAPHPICSSTSVLVCLGHVLDKLYIAATSQSCSSQISVMSRSCFWILVISFKSRTCCSHVQVVWTVLLHFERLLESSLV